MAGKTAPLPLTHRSTSRLVLLKQPRGEMGSPGRLSLAVVRKRILRSYLSPTKSDNSSNPCPNKPFLELPVKSEPPPLSHSSGQHSHFLSSPHPTPRLPPSSLSRCCLTSHFTKTSEKPEDFQAPPATTHPLTLRPSVTHRLLSG